MAADRESVDAEVIEDRAGAVLAEVPGWVWNGERLPVPVEAIADTCFGLLIRDVEDLNSAPGAPEAPAGQALSGLLLAGRGEIWVSAPEAREWPARRRFTIGHELGHWVLHRRGAESIFCRAGTIAPEEAPAQDERPPLPVPEEEASAFAAALLMPAELVNRHYRDCEGDFDELCRRFESSKAAMGRRLHTVVPADRS